MGPQECWPNGPLKIIIKEKKEERLHQGGTNYKGAQLTPSAFIFYISPLWETACDQRLELEAPNQPTGAFLIHSNKAPVAQVPHCLGILRSPLPWPGSSFLPPLLGTVSAF